jgi:flagellar basal body-associated protein FliL
LKLIFIKEYVMAQGNQPIIIEERRSNGVSIAIVAVAVLLIVAALAVLAVMGAGYLFANSNVNNPPAATSQPAQPTQAPAPTDGSILPLGGFQLHDYVSVV